MNLDTMTMWAAGYTAAVAMMLGGLTSSAQGSEPIGLIYDTDMGYDVDDAMALAMVHSMESRGECELLAVTITKDDELSAPFTDAMNHFYGRPDIPIGMVRNGVDYDAPINPFIQLARERDNGELRYPHALESGDDAPEATDLLRQVLAEQPDNSVVFVQVGFSTNLARLLDTEPDEHSPLSGRDLVEQKGRLLSVMAGTFGEVPGTDRHLEHNIVHDLEAAQKLAEDWPTDVVYSGFEIGIAVAYPSESIERDFNYVEHHPVAEAYHLFMPPPHDRPTWDLTSVLWAVYPDRGYFDLSPRGRVTVEDDGYTRFEEDPDGLHRYLILQEEQKGRVREALVQFTSQPPTEQAHEPSAE